MAAPYKRSVFGAQTGLGAMDPVELQIDMGAYANRRTNPHAFGSGHQFGPIPGLRGLGQQVVVQRTQLGDIFTNDSVLPYSFWGAMIGTAAMLAVAWPKQRKVILGPLTLASVSFTFPLLGVVAGQLLATRKV